MRERAAEVVLVIAPVVIEAAAMIGFIAMVGLWIVLANQPGPV